MAPTSPPAGAPTVAPSATPSATPKPSSTPLPSNVDETLVLTSVNYAANTVSVTVDGKAYQPKNGQVFAQYFKLVSILSNTGATDPMNDGASFEYGDQFIQLTVGQSSHFTS